MYLVDFYKKFSLFVLYKLGLEIGSGGLEKSRAKARICSVFVWVNQGRWPIQTFAEMINHRLHRLAQIY
jgi:hypothetical protein